MHIAECGLTEEMPDSCAVTSGTPRNLRPRASCPWRAGKRTGRRRKSISTAWTTRWKTSPPSSGKRADAAPCTNTGRTEGWSRRKATWRKRTNSASLANTWTTSSASSTTTTGISIRATAGGSAGIPSRNRVGGICSPLLIITASSILII